MAQPGTVFSATDVADYLKRYNTNYVGDLTWQKLYDSLQMNYNDAINALKSTADMNIKNLGTNAGRAVTGLDISESRQSSALLQDFSATISDAYQQAMAQRNQLLGSNLGQGFKNLMLDNNDKLLDDAYSSYMNTYLGNKSKIQSQFDSDVNSVYSKYNSMVNSIMSDYDKNVKSFESDYVKGVEEVDKALALQAQNTADYLNAPFDYLKYLFDEFYEDKPEFFESDAMQDYVNREYVNGVLTVTGLKDIGAIRNMMFDLDDNGGYVLNERGKDFYRQIQAMGLNGDITSFGNYLRETNPKLWEWAGGIDPVGSAYSDIAGMPTNRASALGFLGLANDEGIIEDKGYEWKGGTVAENNRPNTVKIEKTDDMPYPDNVTHYRSDSGKSVRTLKYKFDFRSLPKNKNDSNFTITIHDENSAYTVPLEIVNSDKHPEAIMTDEEMNDLDKAVGGLTDHGLYYYDGYIYYSFKNDDGSFVVRKVQGQGGAGAFDAWSTDENYAGLLEIFKGTSNVGMLTANPDAGKIMPGFSGNYFSMVGF